MGINLIIIRNLKNLNSENIFENSTFKNQAFDENENKSVSDLSVEERKRQQEAELTS